MFTVGMQPITSGPVVPPHAVLRSSAVPPGLITDVVLAGGWCVTICASGPW